MRKLGLVVSLVVTTILSLILYPEARSSLAGSREFNQWLGITASNKTWLWLISMIVIGGCLAYIVYKLPRRLRRK